MALSDERRNQIVWQNADDATGVANMLNVQDQDGRNVIARMVSEGHTGELKAASYNGSGGGSTIPDPTSSTAQRNIEHGDPAQIARVNLQEIDALLQDIARHQGRIASLLTRYMPRVPKLAEVERTNLEEANADAGCESCARITTAGGQRLWSKTWRTGRVTAKPKNADKRDKGRHRRALLTGDHDEDLGRLAIALRLCRGCYEGVERRVAPGAGLTLGEAYPLRVLRERLEKARRAA